MEKFAVILQSHASDAATVLILSREEARELATASLGGPLAVRCYRLGREVDLAEYEPEAAVIGAPF